MEYTSDATRVARFMMESGMQVTEIASQLGVHRSTVYRWQQGKSPGRRRRRSKLDPYRDYIRSRLRDYRLPATVMIRELQEQGYDGGITILKDFMKEVKEEYVQEVVDRFETEPGSQAQIDWGECGLLMHEGRRRKLYLLVVVLGYSRYMWAEFTTTTRRPELIRLMERSFRETGGVPRELLVDNMRQVVDQPRQGATPALVNRDFEEFSRWWGFRTVACPPYWPRTKGKVERGIDYVKRSFLEGRSFSDLADLNAQLRAWLADVANVRMHGTVKERPVDRLRMDLAAMGAVSSDSYPSLERHNRLADHDGMISFRGVRYSVDPRIIRSRRTQVEVREGADGILRAYHDGRLVAQHRLMSSGSPPQEDPRHAALRRELAARPERRSSRRGKSPRFAQYDMPSVVERPLEVYEELVSACV